MSDNIENLGEELGKLRKRMEKIEASLQNDRRSSFMSSGEFKIDDLFKWQQNLPPLMDYNVWSVILAKEQGKRGFRTGYTSGGGDYAKISDLTPEDAANLASALSHPARILILRECKRAAQYPSDLEKTVSARYGALYHHLNSLVEGNFLTQERERGKYTITAAGEAALLFLNIMASVIASIGIGEKEAQSTPESATN